jgi:hypothetical protein
MLNFGKENSLGVLRSLTGRLGFLVE